MYNVCDRYGYTTYIQNVTLVFHIIGRLLKLKGVNTDVIFCLSLTIFFPFFLSFTHTHTAQNKDPVSLLRYTINEFFNFFVYFCSLMNTRNWNFKKFKKETYQTSDHR